MEDETVAQTALDSEARSWDSGSEFNRWKIEQWLTQLLIISTRCLAGRPPLPQDLTFKYSQKSHTCRLINGGTGNYEVVTCSEAFLCLRTYKIWGLGHSLSEYLAMSQLTLTSTEDAKFLDYISSQPVGSLIGTIDAFADCFWILVSGRF
jgi:hypothetical protein